VSDYPTAADLQAKLVKARREDVNVELTWPDAETVIAVLERAERLEAAARDAIAEYGTPPERVRIEAALREGP